jgi:hypothetical protein
MMKKSTLSFTFLLLLTTALGAVENTRIPLSGNWLLDAEIGGSFEPSAVPLHLGWFDWARNHFVLGELHCLAQTDCYFRDLLTYPVPTTDATGPMLPLVGDWDGDTRDDVGVFLPETGKVILFRLDRCGLDNRPCLVSIDEFRVAIQVGQEGEEWLMMADWTAERQPEVGLFNGALHRFQLAPGSRTGGQFAYTFFLGDSLQNPFPLAGDWDGDGIETVGIYDRVSQTFHYVNAHDAAAPEVFDAGILAPLSAASLPFAGGNWFGEPFLGILNPGESFLLYFVARAPGLRGPVFVHVPKDPPPFGADG